MLKAGDIVGGIYEYTNTDGKLWKLRENKVTKIVETTKSRKCYTKSAFNPLYVEDVEFNTEQQEKLKGAILVKEVFQLNDITRKKAEEWITWANENIDLAVGVLGTMIEKE